MVYKISATKIKIYSNNLAKIRKNLLLILEIEIKSLT